MQIKAEPKIFLNLMNTKLFIEVVINKVSQIQQAFIVQPCICCRYREYGHALNMKKSILRAVNRTLAVEKAFAVVIAFKNASYIYGAKIKCHITYKDWEAGIGQLDTTYQKIPFKLSWTHYQILIRIEDKEEREFFKKGHFVQVGYEPHNPCEPRNV